MWAAVCSWINIRDVRIASAGISISAPFHAETIWRDDAALMLNLEIDQSVGGIAYHRHVSITGDRFTAAQRQRSSVTEFAAGRAGSAAEPAHACRQDGQSQEA